MTFKTVPQTITAYQTIDGQIFSNITDATNHQNLLEFEKWYNANKLYGRYEGSQIEFEEFIRWFTEHKEWLNQFFPL
jgi:hypothetical protein